MATAVEDVGQIEDQARQAEPEIDYEKEARKIGWKSAEEFGGDPTKHVDAKTYYDRGQELMPVLRAQNQTLLKRLEKMEKEMAKSAEFFSQGEQRAYERALAEIRAEQRAAVETGDVEAHDRASEKLDKLEKPSKPQVANDDMALAEQRAEEFADWRRENKWFDDNRAMQDYATAQADILFKRKGGFIDRSDLDAITDKVKAKFAEEFEAEKPKPRNPVDGGGIARAPRGGKTYADLPHEAKQMCDKWLKNGVIKSREDYVKSYQF